MNAGMGMGMVPGMNPAMMFNNFGGMGNMGDMNMMSMMGMGMNNMGDMGNFGGMGGPGFFPQAQGNYMQSNFGNPRQQPFFDNHGQGRPYGRGFGRGRGQYAPRGRGDWHHQQQYGHQQAHSQGGFQQQSVVNVETDMPARRGSPVYNGAAAPTGDAAAQAENEPDANGTNQDGETGDRANENADTAGENVKQSEDIVDDNGQSLNTSRS
jgi:hypothetical protein